MKGAVKNCPRKVDPSKKHNNYVSLKDDCWLLSIFDIISVLSYLYKEGVANGKIRDSPRLTETLV